MPGWIMIVKRALHDLALKHHAKHNNCLQTMRIPKSNKIENRSFRGMFYMIWPKRHLLQS